MDERKPLEVVPLVMVGLARAWGLGVDDTRGAVLLAGLPISVAAVVLTAGPAGRGLARMLKSSLIEVNGILSRGEQCVSGPLPATSSTCVVHIPY